MAIKAVEKPHFAKCQHLCKQGCSIYSDRPATCREYSCLWHTDAVEGDESKRPDHLGVLFHPTTEGGVRYLELWETKKGASKSPEVQAILKKLVQQGWTEYQVIPWGNQPNGEVDQQMLFRQIDGEWTFQKLVPLEYSPAITTPPVLASGVGGSVPS